MFPSRRVYIESHGCQMNEYDSARLAELLRRDGYESTEDAESADLVLIQTCAIREKSQIKVLSAAGRFRQWKERPGRLLAIGGCVAQQEGDRLLCQVPHADLAFGPDQIAEVPALLRRVEREGRLAATGFVDVEAYAFLSADPRPAETSVTALVTIQKGCDNACAYCVVPHTRGREVSRPADEVVAEVERFVAAGAREVTLIGQNVNSYRGGAGGADDFACLLERVHATPGLLRLRYTTSHPKDFHAGVARAFRDLERLCPWLHLPVQSGSTRVLRAMRREYGAEDYLAKVAMVRALCPTVALTTDVIVGYPGESEEDHRATLRLLEEVGFESIYSFAYSPRPGTAALALGDDVPAAVKARRLREVQALQQQVTTARLARFVGGEVEILVEGESRRGGQACGRTPGNHMVNVTLPEGTAWGDVRGRLLRAEVTQAGSHTLMGRLLEGG